ncbi:MAG: sigma-70 family RNA polymerase sigma factor [Pseudomonas sp.]
MHTPGAAGGGSFLDVFFAQRDRLIRLATRITGCRSQAEDIVHDAFLKLDTPQPTPGIRSQASYLNRVVRNLSIDHYRRQVLEDRLLQQEQSSDEAFTNASATPEELVADRQILQRIAEAMQTMPERTRQVFEMHRIHGMKQREIAQALGISAALVNSLLRDALLRCRDAL